MNLVLDFNDLNKTMKKIASETSEAGKPTRLMYGKVTSANPLVVRVEQRLSLPANFLIVSDHLSKKTATVTVPDWYRNANDNIEVGQREVKVVFDNSLKVGDKVALLREQGGQKFFIIDKVVGK